MSRPSAVTLDEVRAAIDTLKAQGVPDPGVHRIRALIGHGSVTTINKLKHQIRAEELNRVLPGTTKRMPDPITEAAAQLWEVLNAEIDRIDQQREAEVREELTKLQARHEQTLVKIEALTERIDDLQTHLADARQTIEDLTAECEQVSAQRDTAQQENRVLQEQMAAVEKERDHVVEQLATLSRHAAEREKDLERQLEVAANERLRERAKAEAEHQRLEEEVQRWRGMFIEIQQDMKRQIEARESELRQSRQQVKTLTDEIREIRVSLEAVRTENAEYRAHRARLEQALQDAHDRLEEIPVLRQQAERLTQQRDSLAASLRKCQEELAATRVTLKQTNTADQHS